MEHAEAVRWTDSLIRGSSGIEARRVAYELPAGQVGAEAEIGTVPERLVVVR